MTIALAEMKKFRAANESDVAASNGGYQSTNEIITDVKNNLFPDVTEAERTAGVTRWRKCFDAIHNSAGDIAYNPKQYISDYTAGDDYVSFIQATQSNTQADLTGSEDEYGAAPLTSSILATANSFDLTLENSAQIIFRTGDMIRIAGGGNVVYKENVTVSKLGDQVTITLAGVETVGFAFDSSNTVVSSVLEPSDIETSVDGYGGTPAVYDYTTYAPQLDNMGTVEETFTIVFDVGGGGVTFTCTGARLGAIGSGNTGVDFAPNNADYTAPYFTLDKDGWGAPNEGDTFILATHPASAPTFCKQVVPAGASNLSGNSYDFTLTIDS